jgi:hypothetical protein
MAMRSKLLSILGFPGDIGQEAHHIIYSTIRQHSSIYTHIYLLQALLCQLLRQAVIILTVSEDYSHFLFVLTAGRE